VKYPVAIYKQIKEKLLEKISGMEPHTRIPARKELCEEFMVARSTIDKAISSLIADGHLYAINGSGTFVSDFKTQISFKESIKNIAVLLPSIMGDIYPGFLRGIEDVAQKINMNVVICNTDNDTQKQRSYIKRLVNSKVSGIIIIPAVNKNRDDAMFNILKESSIPFVFCNRSVYGVESPLICSNDFYGGFIATTHLIERGYRKIAYITTAIYKTSIDRYLGYRAALSHAGIDCDISLIHLRGESSGNAISEAGGYETMMKLLREKHEIDAVFCFNDRIASGVARAIRDCGLRISDDVGVIGYDDSNVCELLPVKLTSVNFRSYEIGYKAAETLYKMISDPSTEINALTVFEPRLVVRESCKGKKP